MKRLKDLNRANLSQDPSLSRLKASNEFRISRPVGGREYGRFAVDLAVKFGGFSGVTIFGEPDYMPTSAGSENVELGELQIVSNMGLVVSGYSGRYAGLALRNLLLDVADSVDSLERRVREVSLGPPEIMDFQKCSFTQPGLLVASRPTTPVIGRLEREQTESVLAADVREDDRDLFRGMLVVPWLYLSDGAPDVAAQEVREYIAGRELPQVVLESAAYIAFAGCG